MQAPVVVGLNMRKRTRLCVLACSRECMHVCLFVRAGEQCAGIRACACMVNSYYVFRSMPIVEPS